FSPTAYSVKNRFLRGCLKSVCSDDFSRQIRPFVRLQTTEVVTTDLNFRPLQTVSKGYRAGEDMDLTRGRDPPHNGVQLLRRSVLFVNALRVWI
ncbi:MAG: hypothetical protein MN733_42300, partial [Nitrososphaera sp.]|nr:hypothetical protein [Nitrososphaera sp.]